MSKLTQQTSVRLRLIKTLIMFKVAHFAKSTVAVSCVVYWCYCYQYFVTGIFHSDSLFFTFLHIVSSTYDRSASILQRTHL